MAFHLAQISFNSILGDIKPKAHPKSPPQINILSIKPYPEFPQPRQSFAIIDKIIPRPTSIISVLRGYNRYLFTSVDVIDDVFGRPLYPFSLMLFFATGK